MSAIDQAFVKAYARRQLANSKPGPHFSSDNGVVVAPSVADTASVWIDQAGDVALRVDTAHPVSSQPVLPKSLMPKATPATPASESTGFERASVASAALSTKPIEPAAAHVHTAYVIVEGDSSWMSLLAGSNSEAVLANQVAVDEPASPKQDSSIRELSRNRLDPVVEGLEAPHLSKRLQKETWKATSPESIASSTPVIMPPAPSPSQRETVKSIEAVVERRTRAEFRASWEIDALDVPPVVADLFFDSELFQQVAEQLADAAATGLKKVLVTSVHDGEGRSTIAIGLAIAAAASGQRVALVDADVTSPTLVDDLRLDLEFGWIEALRGKIPLQEICVHATQDGVTLVPLLTPHGANVATADETRMLIDSLASSFDLIIVDGGSRDCAATEGSSGNYDSALIVLDQTRTARADMNEYSYRLRLSGVAGVGVVENFVS